MHGEDGEGGASCKGLAYIDISTLKGGCCMWAERAEAIAIRDENLLYNVWQEAIIDMKDIEEFEDAYAIFEMAAEGCAES